MKIELDPNEGLSFIAEEAIQEVVIGWKGPMRVSDLAEALSKTKNARLDPFVVITVEEDVAPEAPVAAFAAAAAEWVKSQPDTFVASGQLLTAISNAIAEVTRES